MSDSLPGQQLVSLATATVTSSGCADAALALDGGTAGNVNTYAQFGLPQTVTTAQSGAPLLIAQTNVNEGHSATFAVVPSISPRFLQVLFPAARLISAVRLQLADNQGGIDLSWLRVVLAGGAAAQFNPFDLLTGGLLSGTPANLLTGGFAGLGTQATVFTPLEDEDGAYLVQFVPPVLTTGIILQPDAGRDPAALAALPANQYPSVRVRHIQIYEPANTGSEGNPPMLVKPESRRVRVGVQKVKLYPWTGAAGPYDATTEEMLEALQELGLSESIKTAKVYGGESVHLIASFETEREGKYKVSVEKCSLRAAYLILGGKLTVTAAAGDVGEKQVWTKGKYDRAPYFRMIAESSNGDGADRIILCKCKVDGAYNYNLSKDEATKLEFDFVTHYDDTYVNRDATVGNVVEMIYAEDGNTSA